MFFGTFGVVLGLCQSGLPGFIERGKLPFDLEAVRLNFFVAKSPSRIGAHFVPAIAAGWGRRRRRNAALAVVIDLKPKRCLKRSMLNPGAKILRLRQADV